MKWPWHTLTSELDTKRIKKTPWAMGVGTSSVASQGSKSGCTFPRWYAFLYTCLALHHPILSYQSPAFRICHLFFRACFHFSLRRVSAGAEQILVHCEVYWCPSILDQKAAGQDPTWNSTLLRVSYARVEVCSEIHIQCFLSEHESSLSHYPPSLYLNRQA